MTMSKSAIHDPALHRKLSEPVADMETASKMGQEFYEEVCKLREKYHVPEMVIAFGINIPGKDGKEELVTQIGYRGGQRTDRLIVELIKQTRFGGALLAFIEELTIASLS